MSWLSAFGKQELPRPVKAPSLNGGGLAKPAPTAAKKLGSPSGVSSSVVPPTDMAQIIVPKEARAGVAVKPAELISTVGDFPARSEVLSGIDSSTPGLRVPVSLQDKLLAVRLSSTQACIAYDPTATEKVKPYLLAFRLALAERGLVVTVVLATEEVLAAIRANEQSRGESRGSSIGAKSEATELFREWVAAAKEGGATDLHMRIMDGGRGEVTVRIDGEIEPIAGSDGGIFTDRDVRLAMTAAFENLADKHSNSDGTFSEAKSMSCMMDTHLGIPNLRLRFSSQRGFFGPKAVVRLLPSEISAAPMPFTTMGFSPKQIALMEKSQRLESGVVLQMGVTGSGKTTVAKTFMEAHPRNGRLAMFQVADPIEYLLRNVHQIYVQRDLMVLSEAGKKDPYSEVIESLMRMDPDVVDVGEVRDFISARALANVGKSGHLAMGTLHADSLAGAINRLTDPKLGLTRQELTSGNLLAFISYQALVPLLCPHCALSDSKVVARELGDSADGRYLGRLLDTSEKKFDIARGNFRFRNPDGCQHCRGRGTKGLTIVSEMMMPEDGWLDLAAAGKDRDAMRWWRKAYSDKDLSSENTDGKLVIEHTIYKAIKGLIDPRSIERFGQLDALEIM